MYKQEPAITTHEAQQAVDDQGSVAAAARSLNVARSTVARALARGHVKSAKPAKPEKSHKGRSITEFAQSYDKDTIIPQKIEATIADMDGWLYESEFVKLAGVSFADVSAYRDKYADHLVYIKRDNKRVWCSTKTMATKLREML